MVNVCVGAGHARDQLKVRGHGPVTILLLFHQIADCLLLVLLQKPHSFREIQTSAPARIIMHMRTDKFEGAQMKQVFSQNLRVLSFSIIRTCGSV